MRPRVVLWAPTADREADLSPVTQLDGLIANVSQLRAMPRVSADRAQPRQAMPRPLLRLKLHTQSFSHRKCADNRRDQACGRHSGQDQLRRPEFQDRALLRGLRYAARARYLGAEATVTLYIADRAGSLRSATTNQRGRLRLANWSL